MKNKTVFLKESQIVLENIFDSLNQKSSISLNSLEPNKTTLIIIDMINGFTREGALKSERIESIIPEVVKLSFKCEELKIQKIAFADHHSLQSPEFKTYPCHCLSGTEEVEMVAEIKSIGGYYLIPKNSTNGFLEPAFKDWLFENPEIDTFIIAGDCTDICILQFAVTLKTHFNRQNKESRIIVPMNAVNTYDLGIHNGDLMHYISLYQMTMNNIEIVSGVNF